MDRPSDAEPRPSVTSDGSLYAASSATGDPTEPEEEYEPDQKPGQRNPNALIEHNRVATAEDME